MNKLSGAVAGCHQNETKFIKWHLFLARLYIVPFRKKKGDKMGRCVKLYPSVANLPF